MIKLIGGMPVSPLDQRIHTTFSNNPSTLRLSSHSPNLQNIPRGNDSEVGAWVKSMFVAPPGNLFWCRDFSGIEAVLVGYFARSPRYTRLAKLGVHDFYNANVLARNRKIAYSDIPDLSWSDADLKAAFKELKKRFPVERDKAKRVVHLSNYRGTPSRMHKEYPETFPSVREAAISQGMYFDLFPEIPVWHGQMCLTVDGSQEGEQWKPLAGDAGSGWIRTPFNVVHRFWHVLDWKRQPDGQWGWGYGEDAKRVIACDPQATASSMMKFSLLSLWCYPLPLDEALQSWEQLGLDKRPLDKVGSSLRLSIHDELLGEGDAADADEYLAISKELMERPWLQLPLPPEWNLGTHLSIGTEAKLGPCWGEMEARP